MESVGAESPVYWPLAAYFLAVMVVVLGMLGSSFVLGQKVRDRSNQEPYESGIRGTGQAHHVKLSVNFYLMATFFVVFDLESVFVFAWALSVRELGWVPYIQMTIFLGVVAAALVYLWRQGALETHSQPKPQTRQGDTP